jgi:protein TonB
MNKAPASLPQLTVVGAVVLAHAAGLWALLEPTLRYTTTVPLQQVTTVMLLSAPAAAAVPPLRLSPPPPALPPAPRVAPPELHGPPPQPAETALPAAATEPMPGDTTHGTVRAAVATAAAEDRAAAPLQSASTTLPRVARHIESVDYLRAPVLQYPSASRRFGEQGTVVLRVLVGLDGQALQIELHEASAFQRLNDAAMQAARRALYKPHTEDGVAQPAWALVSLSFQLRR